jgi:hypothetical protein
MRLNYALRFVQAKLNFVHLSEFEERKVLDFTADFLSRKAFEAPIAAKSLRNFVLYQGASKGRIPTDWIERIAIAIISFFEQRLTEQLQKIS